MWILTQDKKNLVNSDEVKNFSVNANFMSKKKSAIVTDLLVLGAYDDDKISKDELLNLKDALTSGKEYYEMP